MAYNPLSEVQVGKLIKSIDWSNRALKFPRKQRIRSVENFIGPHHSEGGPEKRAPIPFVKMAVDIYVRTLAPQAPRVFITTKRHDLRASAYDFELAVNQVPDEINLGATFRSYVTEALFSMGIVKCGISETGTAMGHPYGQFFADNLTIDDYFIDMSTTRVDQIRYEGNTYWLDYKKVMDSDWVDKKVRKWLEADEYTALGDQGERRTEGIQTGGTAEVYRDRIWLRDVWLPDERLLVTIGVTSKKVLNIVERDEPKPGPYVKLGFSWAPGLLLPVAPTQVWRDLHELGNALYRKLGNQADSEKTVQGFSGGNDESVENFQGAKDGDGITYSGADPKKLTAGGINPNTLVFFMQNKDLSSYFAGNVDALGGLSPMTQTVGQDKLLSEAAGAQMKGMSQLVVGSIGEVFEILAYYEWNDPIKRRTLEKKIPGTDYVIPTQWGRESKQGDFSLYDLSIDVYSLQDKSPGVQLQKLGFILETYVLPLAPLIERANGMIDVQEILADVARFADMPRVNKYVTFVEQTATPQAPQQQGAPAGGDRTTVNAGRPGMSSQGASAVTQQMLLSKGMQDSEAAQVGG